jgi:2-dehydro-3-deoxyphosphogluconate aldolase/(4S)-4-hydroxy-2-oxoglutarate aldolase
MPTGGITAENVGTYLAYDRVVACGGSWMAPAERIAAGAFAWIRDQAAVAALAAGTSGVASARPVAPGVA